LPCFGGSEDSSNKAFDFVLALASDGLRKGPFEGPETVKAPALPVDTYLGVAFD